MTRAVAPTLFAALFLTVACAADDHDETADTFTSTSTTEAMSVESATIVATTTAGPTNAPTTMRVTTPAPSTNVPPTAVTSTTAGSGFAPVPEAPPPDEPVSEGEAGATELAVVQTCDPASPASPAVVLTWRPATASEQLVAVAVLPDGFETGRYTVTDELPAEQASYGLSPVQPGGVYRWRVLTRTTDGWSASSIAEFTGPTCILDAPSSP